LQVRVREMASWIESCEVIRVRIEKGRFSIRAGPDVSVMGSGERISSRDDADIDIEIYYKDRYCFSYGMLSSNAALRNLDKECGNDAFSRQ
jgi:hypothetical protein